MQAVDSWNRDRVSLIAALLLPLGTAAVLVPLRGDLPNTAAALIVVVSIVAVAANGHRLAGLVAALSAAVWFDFFLTTPYEHFTITHRDDIETTALLLLVGAAVTELAVLGRRHKVAAAIDAGFLTAITSTTDLVAAGATRASVLEHVTTHLTSLLSLRACRFESNRFGGLPGLLPDGTFSAGDVSWEGGGDIMPRGETEILTQSGQRNYGRFVVEFTPGVVPSLPARQVSGVLANQVGAALAHGGIVRR